MFEIFTERARTVILEAQAEATEKGDNFIGCEHLLVGLLREGTGLAAVILAERSVTVDAARAAIDQLVGPRPTPVPPDQALATIGIDLGQVRARLEATFGPGALADPPPPYTPLAKESLELALVESSRLHQRYVGTEHELLGLAQVTEGLAAKVLEQLGVDLAALVEDLRGRAAPEEQRVRALLAQRPVLDRMINEVAEDRRDDALGVLQGLGASVQQAMRQEHDDALAATRRLAAELGTLMGDARRQLDALRST
jgi:ATP-dependent Clp protease ATP-binding subunit ClpA